MKLENFWIIFVTIWVFSVFSTLYYNLSYNYFVEECESRKGVAIVSKKTLFSTGLSCYTLPKKEIQNLLSE